MIHVFGNFFLCDFSMCNLAMGLGSRLSPWNLGLSSSQAATCNSSTQQRHASALLNHKKKSQVLKTLKDTETLGLSPCHIPNQQPTTNNHNVSEAPAAKQRKVTSNVRPVWPSKCGVWRPTSSGSSVGPTARGVVSPGSLWLFCLEFIGTSLLGCKPKYPKFWLTLISSGCSENSGPAFLLEFPWGPHANFLEKVEAPACISYPIDLFWNGPMGHMASVELAVLQSRSSKWWTWMLAMKSWCRIASSSPAASDRTSNKSSVLLVSDTACHEKKTD